jgi:hypothetical protein
VSNELRVRTNFLGGLTEDNPLSSVATTLTSAGLAALPAIGSTQHLPIILDPDGVGGNPEIAYITAHTALATTATVTRGQEGTIARAHDRDTPWLHGPTVKDFDAAGGGSGLIGYTAYNPSVVDTVTTSTAHADLDATNLAVSFTVPPSGKVLIGLGGVAGVGNTTELAWGLRESTTDIVTASVMYQGGTPFIFSALHKRFQVTGLTPGTAKTYKWSHARASGASTAQTSYGGKHAAAVMEVWAVNL